jgi:uncharacterized Zn-binding protein involved in type VI secretion
MNNIIKNYNNWLLESVDLIKEADIPVNTPFIIFAGSASNTPFKPAGFENIPANKQFTFTLTGISELITLSGLDPAAFQAKLGVGKVVKPGTNTLTINGTTINGTGDIIITGDELAAKANTFTITASNNGVLAVLRASRALAAYRAKYPTVGIGGKWAGKFVLGLPVNTGSQFEFWTAGQIEIVSTLNTVQELITFIALRQLGKEKLVSASSQENYKNLLGTQTIEEALTKIVKFMSNSFVTTRQLIVSNSPDPSELISVVTAFMVPENLKKYFMTGKGNKYVFTNAAKPELTKIYQAAGKALLPKSATDLTINPTVTNFWSGFLDKPVVLQNYIDSLQAKFNNYISSDASHYTTMTSTAQTEVTLTSTVMPKATNAYTSQPFGVSGQQTQTATPTGTTK